MNASTVNTEKTILRQKLRHRRDHFVENILPQHLPLMFRIAPSPLLALLNSAQCVGAYAPHGSEPDILPMLEKALSPAQSLALPYFSARGAPMEFRVWQPAEALEPGPFKVLQPAATATPAVPDILMVPLVGFDRSLNRLGQGGGHYDRYCAIHPDAIRIGVAWDIQEADDIPIEMTDIPLHGILTQNEWIIAP